MDMQLGIDLAVVGGVGLVGPLALGGRLRWAVAAGAVALSAALPTGWSAAACATVWVAIAASSVWSRLHRGEVVGILIAGYMTVAAVAFTLARAGAELFGIGEPISTLTAVHFVFAGAGALTLAGATLRRRKAGHRVATAAVVLTASAPPIVAMGFVFGRAVPQVGGAIVMAAGVLLTATLQFVEAVPRPTTRSKVLLVVSSAAPWLPMVLAVSWASANYWQVPALSIPDMLRTHGAMNAIFVLTGLLARRMDERTVVRRDDQPKAVVIGAVR